MNRPPYVQFFAGKTVTLMGLGLLGRGVGDAAFLAEHCKKVFVTDTKTADELRVSVDALKSYANIEFYLGGHDTTIFSHVDFVMKGAGVRLDNPYILEAQKNNVPVYMSTALFAHLSQLKIIGITGTRGKSTTTYMVGEILKRAGKKVLMGGNLRGVSTLAMLPKAHEFDLAVLELDSWQMQGFDELKISPDTGVFTTFYPDHMNYYDGNMQQYFYDKASVFRHQKAGDIFITTADVLDAAKTYGEKTDDIKMDVVAALPPSYGLKIPGTHNLLNAALAKATAKACGVDDTTIDAALHDFTGVEGRLQKVGTWNTRDFYNDSNATTQEATLAALTSFPPENVVLIFGGADKGLPLDRMLSYINDNKIRCVLIKGTGSDRVLQTLPNLDVVGSMQDAVSRAKQMSKPNDRIILSPAFASFGVFKNEYDRSDQFMREVQNLVSETSHA